MMTGNTAIHIASQLQSGAPRKAAFLVAVRERSATSFFSLAFSSSSCFNRRSKAGRGHHRDAEVVPRQGKVISDRAREVLVPGRPSPSRPFMLHANFDRLAQTPLI